MKNLITTISAFFIFLCCSGQSSSETEIRKLEDAQREAFLRKDTTAILKL